MESAELDYVQVIAAADVPAGERIVFEIDGEPIALFHVSGQFYAIGDICTHDNGPLAEGELDGYQIICPRHGARFDIRSGQAVRLPAVRPTPWYPVRVVDGFVEIGLPKA